MANFKVLTFFFMITLIFPPFVVSGTAEAEQEEADSDDTMSIGIGDEGAADSGEVMKDGFKVEDHVLFLTSQNFDDAVEKYPTLLVEFYAPWCGHCKSLAPEYSAAAEVLAENDPPVILGKVDSTVQSDLAQRFEVSGYPTLRFFKNGKDHAYEGPRDKDGIVEYMKKIAPDSWEPEPDAVVELTKDNFKETVEKEELMLVEFFAPWCGHCKKLAPIYEKAARTLAKQDPPIILAKVDATKESDLGSKYEVSGYPTLKVFKNGRARDYNGGRGEHDIVSYMIKQTGDGAQLIESANGLKNFFAIDDTITVGFFNSPEDLLVAAYKDAADDMRDDYSFGIVYDVAIRKTYKVNPGSVVVFNAERYYTKFEPKWHVMQVKEETKSEDVKKFVKDHDVPLVGVFEPTGPLAKRYESKRPLCVVIYTVDWSFEHRDATQLWRRKIAAIAKKFPDITFAIVNEEHNDNLIKSFGLEDSPEELNVALYGSDDKRYAMEPMEEYDSEEIEEFLGKYKKGKLKPFLKSQPAPKKQGGPVTVVVGNTFDKIVLDKKKDVLIEIYAPWCGHCKQLEPIYASLAKKLKKEKNLVIAKIDGSANDLPDNFSSTGFPTIYFSPANNKNEPVKYEGARDVAGFEQFLKEKATVSFGKSLKDEL